MKKLIAIMLVLIMLVTALAVAPFSAADNGGFEAGDVLYLPIENPSNWATEPADVTLYVNFTDGCRADNGDRSIVIADADRSRFNPSTGVTYDSAKGLYRYTVTAADAGKSVMRFWRGNAEKLWNESVTLTAADYLNGVNTAVVTDWTNTGYTTSTYSFDLSAALGVSSRTGEVGDPFDITMVQNDPPAGASLHRELYINDVLVSDMPHDTYTFLPDSDGVYSVKAVFTVVDGNGGILAKAVKTDTITVGSDPITVLTPNCLYAHAANGVADKEAWIKWYQVGGTYYFFMPSSAKAYDSVELYSTLSADASIGGTALPANAAASFKPNPGVTYTVNWNGGTRYVQFLFSGAEAALWINNTDTFDGYDDFFSYLKASKENSVAATGAVATPDGKIESADVKKMKGRGNTSWYADKKGFNVTFQSALKLAGMEKCKKFSLVSNFQDAAMARNRILFDLADEVGVPYSSDSRFIDLYTNGVYQGTYQICQKIDTGKNTLISDFEEDDYLDPATGGVKSDFSFVTEIDSSPAADDFHFTVNNGNNLTMKAPELEESDPNRGAVQSYIRNHYNDMYAHLQSTDVGNYLDIDSMAKVYLINELGKNWDTGASSFYFTYKPDKNGVYKFFASPVWDYDNSLGNARGVDSDLNWLGIRDYELPSGWFASKKNGYNGANVLAESINNPLIMAQVRRVWFEEFLPALDKLTSTGVSSGEIYSADVYADALRDSAAMNYKIWELVTNSGWICDHSSLRQYRATYSKNSYGQVTGVQLSQDSNTTRYDQYTFDGQFNYMMDWTTSRAAWISAQYIARYIPSDPVIPTEPPTEEPTLPAEDVIVPDTTGAIAVWSFDAADKTSGDKLTEYGNADNGYLATQGTGKLTLSVTGSKSRALEWSNAEYGKSGSLIVPLMGAGSKNPWGAPYINLNVPTKGYDTLKLTMYLAGSSKAPASWKLQYSKDGTSFTDIDGRVFTISADSRKTLTAYFDKSDLPDFAYSYDDAESVDLRLVPVGMTTIDGGDALTTTTDGELALNHIVVQGRKVTYDDVIMADIDKSGEVDIVDATLLQRYLAGACELTSSQLVAADVTRIGYPDVTDVTVIQRELVGIPTGYLNLPIEF